MGSCSRGVSAPDPGTDPAEDPADARDEQARARAILRLLWWTVPIHALLPLVIGALGWAWERELSWAWVVVHVGFVVVLVWGYPWWRGQGEVVALVVVVNHVVTFMVGMAMLAWVWG